MQDYHGKILFAITKRSQFTTWEFLQILDRMPVFVLYARGRYYLRRNLLQSDGRHSREIYTGILTSEELETWKRRLFELHAFLWGMPKLVDYRATDGADWYFYFAQFKEPTVVHVYNLMLPEDDDPEFRASSAEVQQFRDLVRDLLSLKGVRYTPEEITLTVFPVGKNEEAKAVQDPTAVPAWLKHSMVREFRRKLKGTSTPAEVRVKGRLAGELDAFFRGRSLYSGPDLYLVLKLGGQVCGAMIRVEFPHYEEHLHWLKQYYNLRL